MNIKTIPEITVCLTAVHNNARLQQAVSDILTQENVSVKLILITAEGSEVLRQLKDNFADAKIELLAVPPKTSLPTTRNLAIEKCQSEYLAFTNCGWHLLPNALTSLTALLKNNPAAGMAGARYFEIREKEMIRREHFHNNTGFPGNADAYSSEDISVLLSQGSLDDQLILLRKSAFDIIGKFDEALTAGVDLAFSLHLSGYFTIRVAQDVICYRRYSAAAVVHRRTAYRFRQQILARLKNFISENPTGNFPDISRLQRDLRNDYRGIPQIKAGLKNLLGFPRKYLQGFHRQLNLVIAPYCFQLLLKYFSKWPIGIRRITPKALPGKPAKIAYYTWNFPALSQTFIQREVQALRETDIPLTLFADTCKHPEALDNKAKELIAQTNYILPLDPKKVAAYKNDFRRRHPLRYLNLFIFTITHTYHHFKSFRSDHFYFNKAVYLAGILKEKNITHIHAPWANISAFLVMVAARLLGITYSVQGRAHELHRRQSAFQLAEKFSNAFFAVTNTQFNRKHLAGILNDRSGNKLHQIYNGIDLPRFQPKRRKNFPGDPVRLLSVARLIEEKGLIYLLEACAALRDEGIPFRCEIIGGPEIPFYLNYLLTLKKLHRKLQLENHVYFVGSLPFQDVLSYYQAADIFLLPCVIAANNGRDIIPNSLIEAMAMQLPVIATPTGGIPEMVEHNVSGLIIPPKDPQALAKAIRQLLDHPAMAATLGRNARERVEERFDIQKNIARYGTLFRSALNRKS